jgi:site-specific recombinase XerD
MAQSKNTRRAYRADWAHFDSWCREKDLRSFPAHPATVGLYMAAMAASAKVSTIVRRLAAIAKQHRDAGRYSPCSMKYSAICEVLNGIRREKGTRPAFKSALTTSDLRAMVCALPESPLGLRNKALLLMGFR